MATVLMRRCVVGTSLAAATTLNNNGIGRLANSTAARCESRAQHSAAAATTLPAQGFGGCPVLRRHGSGVIAGGSTTPDVVANPLKIADTANFSTSRHVTLEEDMSTPVIKDKFPAELFPNVAKPPHFFIGPADIVKMYNTTKKEVLEEIERNETVFPAEGFNIRDTDSWRVTLFQFESCPFCRKVRACLDYLKIPYTVEEVHPLTKRELKTIGTDYRKVPVLYVESVEGTSKPIILKDSKRIVHNLMSHCGALNYLSRAPAEHAAALRHREAQWIRWSDDVLVQLIVLNIYRNLSESSETFSYISKNKRYTAFERLSAQISGALVMWLVACRRSRLMQVQDARCALYTAVREFLNSRAPGKTFLGGDQPNEADINIYGVLRSIDGFAVSSSLAHPPDFFMGTLTMAKLKRVGIAPTATLGAENARFIYSTSLPSSPTSIDLETLKREARKLGRGN